MIANIDIVKGVHPGIILGRELRERGMSKIDFARNVNEFPQTIGAIIKGKRRMNAALSVKIADLLNVEDGYFMALQAYYDVKQERIKNQKKPNLSIIREVVFWDTDINTIDWERYKPNVIKRVFTRGNEQEQAEIRRFYGDNEVDIVLSKM